jgi:transposase InsO family protein
MEERLRFVARLLEGEPMSDVCREFGISRKTGYKLFERYREEGPVALADRSRRPVRYANQLPAQVESLIIACKREKPHWGARHKATGTPLSTGAAPNDLWSTDFKGEFKLGNGRYCYPLTVADHASRFIMPPRTEPGLRRPASSTGRFCPTGAPGPWARSASGM